MTGRRRGTLARVTAFSHSHGIDWHEGTHRSQVAALVTLLTAITAAMVVSIVDYDFMPIATYFVWLLVGMLVLSFRPLVVLAAWTVAAAVVAFATTPFDGARVTALVVLALSAVLVLVQASRLRGGLPAQLGATQLADLRDLLQRQGQVPSLPEGWTAQSAMRAAHGVGYGGDFMVAELTDDKEHLQMVLVDVCGKGVSAGPRSLQLAGALQGLVGSVADDAMLPAVNRVLMRQESLESLATAVQVCVDLRTGAFDIRCAGHPPALRWTAADGVWALDGARGTALGVVPDPELDVSHGVLEPGDALMFYTDGVVEARGADLDDGIGWLQETARTVVGGGFDDAARRIIRTVPRGDDDRAVLILRRTPRAPTAASE